MGPRFITFSKYGGGVKILKSWRKEDPFPPLAVASSALDKPAPLQILAAQATHDVSERRPLMLSSCSKTMSIRACVMSRATNATSTGWPLCSLVVTHCTTTSLIACRSGCAPLAQGSPWIRL